MIQHSYSIIGDNLDFYIKVKHMTMENRNKSIHWFNMLGIQHRVTGSGLDSESPIKELVAVKVTDFIPKAEDHTDLLEDLVPIAACVVVDYLPTLKIFRKIVVRHIPHKYSKEMNEKTTEVCFIPISM